MTTFPEPLTFSDYIPTDSSRSSRSLRMRDIQAVTAHEFNINIESMTSKSRERTVVRPRQVAMYLCRELTGRSLPEIGNAFGGRDHTTVIHAIKAVTRLIVADLEFAERVIHLRDYFEAKLAALRAPMSMDCIGRSSILTPHL